ncbi:hypothetical protein ABZ915_12105 [Streptomyces sp. NPDC046915]|uniref:hypothetical protein n=1 Tax=Streptomyces sp. NPDC046915 TaxID=3155257 RepID=UPI0033E1618B
MTAPIPAASQLAVNVLDAHSLLASFGVLGVAVVMFAETGLLVGFFLPGDSWSVGLTLAGYALGSSIPNVDRYLLPLVALIVVVSLVPLVAEVYRGRRAARFEEGRG